MNARPGIPAPLDAVEILAYPLRRVACPLCAPPAGAQRIGRCPRCNGAGAVYRSPTPAIVDHDPEVLA